MPWPHHRKGDRRWPMDGYITVIGAEAQDAVFIRTDVVALLGAMAAQLRTVGDQRWLNTDEAEVLRGELVALSTLGLSDDDRQTVTHAIELVAFEIANRTGVAVAPPNADLKTAVTGPVFTFSIDGYVRVHLSPEKAAGWMEAIDVEGGEYEVIYDDSGLVYEPDVVGDRRVALVPTDRRDLDDLVRRLEAFGERTGLRMPEARPGFTQGAAEVLAAWEWDRRWPKRPRWLSRRIHGPGPKFGSA